MIVSDIDGTLLGPDHVVTDRTIAALQAAHEDGVIVVGATGRSHWSAKPLLEPIGCVRWLLASNGATLYDMETHEIVRQHPIERDLARNLIRDLHATFEGVGFSWETPEGVFQDENFRAIRSGAVPSTKLSRRKTIEFDVDAAEIIKMMVLHPELADIPWLEAVQPLVPDELSFSTSGIAFVEVTAPAADKGVALAALCEELGVHQESTVTFGDQSNDLGMLSWAGRGYAMGNAHERAVEAASHRAPHHLEDGVAQVVEQLLIDKNPTGGAQ